MTAATTSSWWAAFSISGCSAKAHRCCSSAGSTAGSPTDVATTDGSSRGTLADRVVIVSAREPDAARALATAGATVVAVGSDADATGKLVRSLVDAGHRAVGFVGDPERDAAALGEMVAELFPDRDAERPEPA